MIEIKELFFENYEVEIKPFYLIEQKTINKDSSYEFVLNFIVISDIEYIQKNKEEIAKVLEKNQKFFDNVINGTFDDDELKEKIVEQIKNDSFEISFWGKANVSSFEDTRLFINSSNFNYIYSQYNSTAIEMSVKKYIRNNYFLKYQNEDVQTKIKAQIAQEEKNYFDLHVIDSNQKDKTKIKI